MVLLETRSHHPSGWQGLPHTQGFTAGTLRVPLLWVFKCTIIVYSRNDAAVVTEHSPEIMGDSCALGPAFILVFAWYLGQPCPELSMMAEIFCICTIQYGSEELHFKAAEHLTEKLKF